MRLIKLAAFLIITFFSHQLKAQEQGSYGFQGSRYSSLAAAEAAMRAAYGERGRELRLCGLRQGWPDPGGTFEYCFNDVALLPPSTVGHLGLWLEGEGADYSGYACRLSGRSEGCASEEEMI